MKSIAKGFVDEANHLFRRPVRVQIIMARLGKIPRRLRLRSGLEKLSSIADGHDPVALAMEEEQRRLDAGDLVHRIEAVPHQIAGRHEPGWFRGGRSVRCA